MILFFFFLGASRLAPELLPGLSSSRFWQKAVVLSICRKKAVLIQLGEVIVFLVSSSGNESTPLLSIVKLMG